MEIISFSQLKAEKAARQAIYYSDMEKIARGIIKPNPALRHCKYKNIRQSNRKLVRPSFASM